jgi:hypothetical protein
MPLYRRVRQTKTTFFYDKFLFGFLAVIFSLLTHTEEQNLYIATFFNDNYTVTDLFKS